MFSIFKLKEAIRFSEDEEAYLHLMLQRYSVTRQGLWLQELDYRRFHFRWCPAMRDSGGVMGCFSPLFPQKIFLLPQENVIEDRKGKKDRKDIRRAYWIEQLFPVIIHELRHAYQWRKCKLGYILCALPVLREITLEKGANEAQQQSESFAVRWTAEWDHREAAERGLASDVKTGKNEE